jgi:hypothetical protein
MRIMTVRIRAALAAVTTLVVGSMTLPASANVNLAPNPSFENYHLPQQIAEPAPGVRQPILPRDWIFEGATELFDHASTHAPFPPSGGGKYFVQISGSWSGPRTRECSLNSASPSAPCVDVPGGAQRDQIAQYYSIGPAWRTQSAIPVNGGTRYTFSTYISNSFPLDGTGAVTKVRWLDANGVPIGISNGPSLMAPNANSGANYYTFALQSAGDVNAYKEHDVSWTKRVNNNVLAPANARGAVLLLGYSDSAWIGSVSYDLVCFGVYQATGDVCA